MLVIPVIAIIVVYQLGILLGNSITIYNSDEPFFFIQLLLLISVVIIVFSLVTERRLAYK